MLTRSFCAAVTLLLLLFLAGVGFADPETGGAPVTIWAGKSTQHAVALTFDDGPSPVYTGEILDLLHEYQAKATFFVLGEKVEQHPEIIKAMIRGGHEVGNHTFDHVRLTKASQRVREQELERTALDLELLGCPRAGQLVRPPYSDFDKRLVSFLKHNHQELALWSLDSGDWQGLDTPTIVHNVLDRIKNGSIVIFHDSDEDGDKDRRPTVEALKVILPALRDQGYQMVTISELMGTKKRVY